MGVHCGGALGRGSLVGLFAIAFTAVLRESVETAIFLQGLSLDSPSGVAWGCAAGAVALTVLVLFINLITDISYAILDPRLSYE